MQPYYVIRGSEKSVPILLLHELGGSHASWQWIDPELEGHFRRILVDLPGAGKSPLLGDTMSLDEIAACLVELLDSLGIERINLAGVAYGAIVSAYLAGRYPERISAVMMIAIGTHISEGVAEYVRNRADQVEEHGMDLVVDYSLKSSFPEGFPKSYPDQFRTYRKIFTANDPHNYAVVSRAIADAGTILTDRIKSIRCTAAVAGGQDDPTFTPEVLAQVGNLMIPPVKPVAISGAGHFPQIQAPHELARLMVRFFIDKKPIT